MRSVAFDRVVEESMTLPKIPFRFRPNETLVPSKLLQNFQRIAKDIEELKSRQVVRFSVALNFDGMTSATSADALKVNFSDIFQYVELEGIEVIYYHTAGVVLGISDSTSTLMTVEAEGATTRTWAYKSQLNVALTTLNFAVASGTVTKLDVIVHCKSYRFGGGRPSLYELDEVLNGSFTAANVNSEFTEIATEIADDTSNRAKPMFLLFHRRNFTSLTNIDEFRIPATGKAFTRMILRGMCAAGADTLTVTLKDKTGATVGGTLTIAATGADSSDTRALSETQPDTGSTTATDYKLVFSRTGATNWQNAYCIIEYEE
jgi:hypothetical protein